MSNKIERVSRAIINRRLMMALTDDRACVAALLTKEDLDVLISALGAVILDPEGSRIRDSLNEGFRQLRQEAFP